MKTVYDEVYFYVILITFNGESNFPQFSHCEKSAFDDTKIIAYYKTSIHHFTAFLRQKAKKILQGYFFSKNENCLMELVLTKMTSLL